MKNRSKIGGKDGGGGVGGVENRDLEEQLQEKIDLQKDIIKKAKQKVE